MIGLSIRRRIADFIAPEAMEQRRVLERLANTDELTGLANRRALDLALPTAEDDPETSIVVFDANNFAKLNKAAGHKFGDVVIKEMATTIKNQAGLFGFGERVFRYGGDEFVVLCPARIAGIIRDNCEAKFAARFPAFSVSLVGTVGDTFATADAALQDRKQERKDRDR